METENIEITLEPLAEYTGYAPLAVIGYWLRRSQFLAPLWSELYWPVKVYQHTLQAKLETILASILAGNRALYQINTTLRPDRSLARAWGQEQFPEQSTVADLLNQATEQQVEQLQRGCAALWHQHSRALHHNFDAHWLVLDYDLTGLLVSKHAEGSEKGYFSGHRNRYGRQLVRISAPAYHETLGSFLYPGNTLGFTTLKPTMTIMAQRLNLSPEQRRRTIVRSDGGIGTDANVNWLLWSGYQVVTKGFSHTRAAALARQISPDGWEKDPERERWIAPAVSPPRFGRKASVYVLRWETQKGFRYGTLINTVPGLSPLGAWQFCDGRGAAEVEIRADRQGLHLPRRRKHSLAAQMVLILLTDVAHNLLSWLHAALLADGPCADFGTLRMVEDLLTIPGRIEFEGENLRKVSLLATHPYAPLMRTALQKLLQNGVP
ncbi:MAG: hypothetical protein D6750_09770 [Bacteroidetes bacterium]|nr:MAG: hypothetical protein D6750_09770 [Bacteroidota bacterium]